MPAFLSHNVLHQSVLKMSVDIEVDLLKEAFETCYCRHWRCNGTLMHRHCTHVKNCVTHTHTETYTHAHTESQANLVDKMRQGILPWLGLCSVSLH